MTYEERRTTVERDGGYPPAPPDIQSTEPMRTGVVEQRESVAYRPSASTVVARFVVVLFGIAQALIVARIVLLLLDAQQSNSLVSSILHASQVFVGPFEGMFRTDALAAGGAVLDIAAITAFIALTIVELVVLAIVRIPRRTEGY